MELKKICKNNNITMTEVAKRMGVTLCTLSKVASGNPSLSKLKEIAGAIGCSLNELLADEEGDRSNAVTVRCPDCGSIFQIEVKPVNKDKEKKNKS